MDIRVPIPGCHSGFDYVQTVGYERHVVAVDLGSKQDHTAIVVFKDYQVPMGTLTISSSRPPVFTPSKPKPAANDAPGTAGLRTHLRRQEPPLLPSLHLRFGASPPQHCGPRIPTHQSDRRIGQCETDSDFPWLAVLLVITSSFAWHGNAFSKNKAIRNF